MPKPEEVQIFRSHAPGDLPKMIFVMGGKPLCSCAASPLKGLLFRGGKPLCRCASPFLQSGSSLKQPNGLFLNARPSQGGENSDLFS